MANKILVTPRSLTSDPHPEVERMRELGFHVVYCTAGAIPTEEELISLLPDCIGWLAGVEPVSERVVEAATSLKLISRNGTGVDNLPLEALARRGIKVAVAEAANARGVAELTIGLLFAAIRSIPAADNGIKRGEWPRRRGIEIKNRTVGVVGCGAIGREVAAMAIGLGANVVAFDPARPNLDLPSTAFRFAEMAELLSQSDVVTLHCPAPRDGRPILDKAAIASLKSSAIVINTARATLVDDVALKDALDRGTIEAYATDVFEHEPPRDLTLARHGRVIATSHVGGFTTESVDRATAIAAANLINGLSAEDRPHA